MTLASFLDEHDRLQISDRQYNLAVIEWKIEREALQAQLQAMVEDRDLWKEAHDDDCPNKNMLEATEAQLQAVTQERDQFKHALREAMPNHYLLPENATEEKP